MSTPLDTPTPATLARIAADIETTRALFERLRERKTEIALLRRQNMHLTAEIQRDEMLAQIETWLDPEGAVLEYEQLTKQRQIAAARALAIDPIVGF